jgi:hypothetical protein
MLGRHGLYMREQNIQLVYLVFKGVDLHSGFHPSYTSHNKEAWLKDLNSAWESTVDRVALVSYPTEAICNRLAPMSISPPLHFSNLGQPISHKAHQQNFSQNSRGILFFFFFCQQFITRGSLAVCRPAVQTVRTLRLRYALPITTYQVLEASFWRATTDIRPTASSKTMSPFRAVNAGTSHQAVEIAMSIPRLPSERSPDQNPPQRAGQSLEGVKPP